MIRQVLRFYWGSKKQAVKHLADGLWIIYPYFIFCYQLSWANVVIFLSIVVPMCMGSVLSAMYPNRMSKLLLLCPMSKAEQYRYLRTGYWLRVAVPLAVYLVWGGILTFNGRIRVVYYLIIFFTLLFFLAAINICNPFVKADKTLDGTSMPGYMGAWYVGLQLEMPVDVLVLSESASVDVSQTFWLVAGNSALFVLQGLLCGKIVVSYYKTVMEQGVRYIK